MAARFGARPVFLAAIVILTVASIGCAASTSLTELVAMRSLQGIGGALMVPVGGRWCWRGRARRHRPGAKAEGASG